MRPVIVSFLLCLVVFASFGQDDYIPTYHSKLESFSKIRDQNIRADLATFTLAGLVEAAGKTPLDYIPVTAYGQDSAVLSKDNIQVHINAENFNPSKHKILKYDEKYVIKIDNKPYYGIDGQMPKKHIQSVFVVNGKDTIYLPAAAYTDLYEPHFCGPGANDKIKCNCGVYLSPDKSRMYIYMLNSDGYTGYEVTWILQNNQYLRRVIDTDF